MQTRDEYLKEAEIELGERKFKHMRPGLDNSYYRNVASQASEGNPISGAVYDSLSEGQRFHFNKHYNHRGTMVRDE